MANVEIRTQGYQRIFCDPQLPVCVVFGAKGSGKTFTGALWALFQFREQGKGLIILNTLAQARDIFRQNVEPLLKQLGWAYSFNESRMELDCMGSIVHFRSAERDVIKRIESIEYDWGWADELSYFDPEAVRVFASRIRKGKAHIRITSMPDEPDHFCYRFTERLVADRGGRLFEVSLRDNPDAEFRERYEAMLRATYQGDQLARYLEGRRVSLAGQGLFNVLPSHRGDYPLDPKSDLLLSWDFNVEYCAVSGWQQAGITDEGYPIIACVKGWQLKEATVFQSAAKLAQELSHMGGIITLHGDASGQARTATATESMWAGVKRIFLDAFGDRLRYKVPSHNPSVKDTIQCVNWALGSGALVFDSNQAGTVYSSLLSAKADKYGELDKSQDMKPNATRSHDADTARYAAWHYHERNYPARKTFFIV